DNAGERGWITNGSNALRYMASPDSEVLSSPKWAGQGLAFLRWEHFTAMALHVAGAVEMVTCVWVPVSIAHRQHDEKLAPPRTPNPQREPEVGALSDCHRVPML